MLLVSERKRHKDILFCDADLTLVHKPVLLLSLSVPENNLTAEWLIGVAFNLFDDSDTHISFSLPAENTGIYSS